MYASTIVREAGGKGRGLYAKTDIQKDSFITEYVGEVIPLAKVSHRKARYKAEGQSHLYFLTPNSESHRGGPPRCVIDATKKGNNSRFINHSCMPNCYVEGWHVGESVRMGIFANQFISEGEELTFDYNFNNNGDDSNQRACLCGAPTCRGSLDLGGKEACLELKRTRSKPKVPRSTSVRAPAKSTPLANYIDSPKILSPLTLNSIAGAKSFSKVHSPGPGISQNARTFARLACPFFRKYPHACLSKTCSRGSPDFRHVKYASLYAFLRRLITGANLKLPQGTFEESPQMCLFPFWPSCRVSKPAPSHARPTDYYYQQPPTTTG